MAETTDKTIETPEPRAGNPVLGWTMFAAAMLPLVALLTYDWHSIARLHTPAMPTANWIGPLGDAFAYYGYNLFGIAIWVVPLVCIVYGIRVVFGHRLIPSRRCLWFALLMVCSASLVQIGQRYAPGIESLRESTNISNAGGAIGYLLSDLALTPLLSDIGATALLSFLIIVSAVASIGLGTLARFFASLFRWAMRREEVDPAKAAEDEAARAAAFEAAKAAKLAAKEQARAEKERLRAEKEEAKERARQEREAERERVRLEKEAAAARLTADSAPPPAGAVTPAAAGATAANANTVAGAGAGANKPAPSVAGAALSPRRQPPSANAAAAKAAAPAPAQPPAPPPEPPKEDKGPYVLPPIDILSPIKKVEADHSDVGIMSQKLLDTLKLFNIEATLSYTVQGPVVTKYAILLAPGTRYQVVSSIADNLKGALHAKSLRIETPIPGEEAVGIEVPNRSPAGISFREILESEAWTKFNRKAELPLLFGRDAAGNELMADLATMPHMLVAGATGQGKSVCLNSLINGLLMSRTPEQLKLIMVDPKTVEFTPFCSIPHLLVPVITDNRKVVFSLHWAVAEMEKRLKMFARAKVKNIYDFNHRSRVSQPDMFGNDNNLASDLPKTVPYIVIIIDEAADLIGQCGKDVNPDIQRITQKARAAGIHIILATQRPDAKIITGAIKANIPGRVAFKTASSVDSRTILDDTGAENLIGRGDMLFKGKDGNLIRAQGAWISDDDIASVTAFIEEHSNVQFDETFATKLGRVKEASIGDPFADNEDDPDNQKDDDSDSGAGSKQSVKASEDADLFKRALECIINTNRASVSHFQRRLAIGYNHAAKLCDKLEDAGVIAAQSGAGPRTILLNQQELLNLFNGGSAEDGADTGADGGAAGADDAGAFTDAGAGADDAFAESAFADDADAGGGADAGGEQDFFNENGEQENNREDYDFPTNDEEQL